MNKPKSFILLIIFTVVILSVVQVIVSNGLSTTGAELAKLREEHAFYNKQNIVLRQRLLSASSYLIIESKASTLGFVEEKSRIFLSTPLPLAVKP